MFSNVAEINHLSL